MNDLVQKVEGAKQEINTGMTLNEMWSKQAEHMEILDKDSVAQDLLETVTDYLRKHKYPQFVMLNSRINNYMTIFQDNEDNIDSFAELITTFLLVDTIELGGLKMYSTEDNDAMIQLYIGNTHYALFNCEHLVVSE